MRMRCAVAIVAILAGAALPASAAENFIPQGHSYAPGENELPPLNSEQDQFNNQTDTYQSEIYVIERQQKQWDTDWRRFLDKADPTNVDPSLEY